MAQAARHPLNEQPLRPAPHRAAGRTHAERFSFVENNSTAKTSEITDAMDGLAATVNGCWA